MGTGNSSRGVTRTGAGAMGATVGRSSRGAMREAREGTGTRRLRRTGTAGGSVTETTGGMARGTATGVAGTCGLNEARPVPWRRPRAAYCAF